MREGGDKQEGSVSVRIGYNGGRERVYKRRQADMCRHGQAVSMGRGAEGVVEVTPSIKRKREEVWLLVEGAARD